MNFLDFLLEKRGSKQFSTEQTKKLRYYYNLMHPKNSAAQAETEDVVLDKIKADPLFANFVNGDTVSNELISRLNTIYKEPDYLNYNRFNDELRMDKAAEALNNYDLSKASTKRPDLRYVTVTVDRGRYMFISVFDNFDNEEVKKNINGEDYRIAKKLIIQKINGDEFHTYFSIKFDEGGCEIEKGAPEHNGVNSNDDTYKLVEVPRDLLVRFFTKRNMNIRELNKDTENDNAYSDRIVSFNTISDQIVKAESNSATSVEQLDSVESQVRLELSKNGINSALFTPSGSNPKCENDGSNFFTGIIKYNSTEKNMKENNPYNEEVESILQDWINKSQHINVADLKNFKSAIRTVMTNLGPQLLESDWSPLSYSYIKGRIDNSDIFKTNDENLKKIKNNLYKNIDYFRNNTKLDTISIGTTFYSLFETVHSLACNAPDKKLKDQETLVNYIVEKTKGATRFLKQFGGLTKEKEITEKNTGLTNTESNDSNKSATKATKETVVDKDALKTVVKDIISTLYEIDTILGEWNEKILYPYISAFVYSQILKGQTATDENGNSGNVAFAISDNKYDTEDDKKIFASNREKAINIRKYQKDKAIKDIIKYVSNNLFGSDDASKNSEHEFDGHLFYDQPDILKFARSDYDTIPGTLMRKIKLVIFDKVKEIWNTQTENSYKEEFDLAKESSIEDSQKNGPHDTLKDKTPNTGISDKSTFARRYGWLKRDDSELINAIDELAATVNKSGDEDGKTKSPFSVNAEKFFASANNINDIIKFMFDNGMPNEKMKNLNYETISSVDDVEGTDWYALCMPEGATELPSNSLDMIKTLLNNLQP